MSLIRKVRKAIARTLALPAVVRGKERQESRGILALQRRQNRVGYSRMGIHRNPDGSVKVRGWKKRQVTR